MFFFKSFKNFIKDFVWFIHKEFLTKSKKHKTISSIYLEGEDSFMPKNEVLPFIKKK
jgi:hypothetical protein